MIQYDLIDNNLNQIFSDPYSINKSMLRIVLVNSQIKVLILKTYFYFIRMKSFINKMQKIFFRLN